MFLPLKFLRRTWIPGKLKFYGEFKFGVSLDSTKNFSSMSHAKPSNLVPALAVFSQWKWVNIKMGGEMALEHSMPYGHT